MLKLLDEKDIDIIKSIGDKSLLGTRIVCYSLSYGFNTAFLDIWASDKALISRFEDTFTLVASTDADFGEIEEFLNVIGCIELVTDEKTAKKLTSYSYEIKKAYIYRAENQYSALVTDLNENDMKNAYALIGSSIPGSFSQDRDSYLSFLSDFRYRQNRGFARGKCIKKEGIIVSTSVTAAETATGAIISGVACRNDFRGEGFGKMIVTSLAEELKNEGKNAYVIALNKKAEGFYEHIGFEETEKIAYIKRCNNV